MGLFDKITKPITGFLTGGDTVNQSYAQPDAGMDQILGVRANENTLDPIGTSDQNAMSAMAQAKPLYDAASYSSSSLPASLQAAIKSRGEQAYASDLDQIKKQMRMSAFGQSSDQQQSSFGLAKTKNAMMQGQAEARAKYDQERSAIRQGLISNLLGTAGQIAGMIAGGMSGGSAGAIQGASVGKSMGSGLTGGAQSTSTMQLSRTNQMSSLG